ncbi:MAG: 2-phospho-L-lactate guanylyltransferase [Actinobacteria bacterium]|nr:2-phospho-L-lactate guanylyltransferase [Actinomycetota bacterium]
MAVVPVKSFETGKERLAGALDPAAREFLVRAMAERVLATVETVGLLPVVVTDSVGVAEWAALRGLPTVADPGQGLSAAAEAGVSWAGASGSDWLVLHADLPLLQASDVEALARPLVQGQHPIAPSADGGTSALGSRGQMTFSYGKASFHRHLPRLASPRVVVTCGLAHDVDTPSDLASARRHRRGAWLDHALG